MELKHNYSYRHSHVVSSVSCAFYVYHPPIIFVWLINLSLISLEKNRLEHNPGHNYVFSQNEFGNTN